MPFSAISNCVSWLTRSSNDPGDERDPLIEPSTDSDEDEDPSASILTHADRKMSDTDTAVELYGKDRPKGETKSDLPEPVQPIPTGVTHGDNFLFDPHAKFPAGSSFGAGCRFSHGTTFGSHCTFGPGSSFGSRCVFGDNCTFGLRCIIGPNSTFGARCNLPGHCTIFPGAEAKLGIKIGVMSTIEGMLGAQDLEYRGLFFFSRSSNPSRRWIFNGDGYKSQINVDLRPCGKLIALSTDGTGRDRNIASGRPGCQLNTLPLGSYQCYDRYNHRVFAFQQREFEQPLSKADASRCATVWIAPHSDVRRANIIGFRVGAAKTVMLKKGRTVPIPDRGRTTTVQVEAVTGQWATVTVTVNSDGERFEFKRIKDTVEYCGNFYYTSSGWMVFGFILPPRRPRDEKKESMEEET